jgi:hypothetical protein
MELRNLVLISVSLALAGPVTAVPVKHWPLDDRATYPVRLGTDAPTTIAFPGPLTALEGANVSARSEESPAVLLAYQTGANFFSLRALRPDAAGAVNVVFRGKIFALTFTTGPEPDRSISFREGPAGGERSPRSAAALWLSVLDRAKKHAALVEQYPALAQNIERIAPKAVTDCVGFTATIEEVFRFADEDALVFRIRLDNPNKESARYAVAQLAIRAGSTVIPASLVDASGVVEAQAASEMWIVIGPPPAGARVSLSLKNDFSVVAPAVR